MAKRWTVEQRKFIEWLATPDIERDHHTQRALAEHLGVHEVTLSGWKDIPELQAEVNRLVDQHLGSAYPKAAEALVREAHKGSYQHLKLLFEMLGKYVQKQEVTGKDGGAQEHVIEVVYVKNPPVSE